MTDETFLGVKAATAVAGFVGALASLSAIKQLTRAQALMAVMVGTATSAYLTPALAYYTDVDAIPLINAMAFILGLAAMHIVPGILHIAEKFRDDPTSFFKRPNGGKEK